jgi:alpha-N-arabinofuranosidase
LRELKADIVDEHCYARPDWFYQAAGRYDGYDRTGPKVFFGEYAAQSERTLSVDNRNNLECALAEAACMTGLERNGDVVCMASYAPLFAHIDAWQWKPDLIWVDNLASYGTPSYYVQKLFANHPGDATVPIQFATAGTERLFASATRDRRSREAILKVVNGNAAPAKVELDFRGAKHVGPHATVLTLTSGSALDENSFAEPTKVVPRESHLPVAAAKFSYAFPANSLTVLRLSLAE